VESYILVFFNFTVFHAFLLPVELVIRNTLLQCSLMFSVMCSVMFLTALVKRFFDDECILFVQTKKGAHRMRLVLNLLGVKAGELHGNLTQPQVRNP